MIGKGIQSYGEVLEAEVETLRKLSPAAVTRAMEEASSAAHAAIAKEGASRERQEPDVRGQRIAEETAGAVMRMLAEIAERYEMSKTRLKEQADAVLGITRAILSGRPDVLDTLTDIHAGEEALSDEEVEELNAARLLALHNRIRADSHTGKDLEPWGLQRQRLHQLRNEDRLFAIKIPQQRGLLYPRWQFDPETHREREGLPELITAAKDLGVDPLSFHLIMTNPDAGNGTAPLELLDSGELERVQAILRANSV